MVVKLTGQWQRLLQLCVHFGRCLGPDPARHPTHHGFDGMDELPPGQRDQVGARLAHRKCPPRDLGPDLLRVRIRSVLKHAGETQPVRHGKNE